MPLPSLCLPRRWLALAGLSLLACTPRSQPDATPPGSSPRIEDDEQLPEKPPIERSAELMAGGQTAAALALLDEALTKQPRDPELHYARGVALEQLGRPQEAVGA